MISTGEMLSGNPAPSSSRHADVALEVRQILQKIPKKDEPQMLAAGVCRTSKAGELLLFRLKLITGI